MVDEIMSDTSEYMYMYVGVCPTHIAFQARGYKFRIRKSCTSSFIEVLP